ncbi:hypothetical protein SeMB42_g02296 [Synchytrium endobioticum]|uniref:Activator of Hsp90 ATPase AHSA1-like N-terminal domain-containing protein n=1 Tax=Synchytrium endobioticum TaxID=286115 RepID=A0A507DFH7_9FUNG|nr:hypothetical protein SeLEV6574_g04921 [Synchytrium endobioticum]TPX50296.1 hypothetical protein SeMB42_g02296 [Synchytrium endobioticum]
MTQTNWKNVGNWHWVQKNVGDWAKEYIRSHLVGSSESEGAITIKIIDLVSMEGDAELSQRKGKIITIFDLQLSFSWEGTNQEGTRATGRVDVPEFDHDSKVNNLPISVCMDGTDNAQQTNFKEVADKLLPKLISAGLKTFQSDMVTAHGKDVFIPPEEMNKHPTSPSYKPATQTIAASAAASLQSAQKAAKSGLLGGVITLEQSVEFVCSADDLMEVFFDQGRVAAWTRNKAVISRIPGSDFSLFGDNVTGILLEYEAGKRFTQKWRLRSWPAGHFSTATFVLEQGDESTILKLHQKDVPVGEKEITQGNWTQYYWNPIKATFGYGSLL